MRDISNRRQAVELGLEVNDDKRVLLILSKNENSCIAVRREGRQEAVGRLRAAVAGLQCRRQ